MTEEAVERAFVKALKELIGDIGDIKKILKGNIIESLDDSIPERLERVQIETEDLQTKMIELTRAKRSGVIDYDECNRKGMELAEKIRELNNERAELESRSADVLVAKNRITEILKTLEEITPTEKFDGEMFLKLVDEVIIKDGTGTFMFKVGINKKIEL